ncbi:hypothetical protein RHOSPDRAFT_32372 [Rhodotorula sp. JG-1b]|nr:hypothetical protein RHOSPDRAFT_32372 [Rhodotorula sp. JG-1b]
MESGRRPRKRVKPAVDAAAESFSRLVASCTRLTQLIQEDRNASDALQDELAVTADRLTRFETALRSVDVSASDELLPEGWRDQLDCFGTSLWNQSAARRYALNQLDEAQRPAARNDVAALRQRAFDLLRLGDVDSGSPAASLAQISLATKTACAFLDAGQPARAETLIARIGETASAVASTEAPASNDSAHKRTKILLAYYCCRIRIAVARKTTPVASWLRDRAKALLGRAETSWREVELLVRTAYDTGLSLLRTDDAGRLDSQIASDTESAIEWLRFSLSLLEGGQPDWTSPLQVAVLKALAHAYLTVKPAQSRWGQAEETLRMVLELEPEDAASTRRLLKLVIARGSSINDIEDVLMKALSQVQDEATEIYNIVATLELLPQNKKTARLGILLSVCQRLVSTLDTLPSTTLSHLVSAAFLLASESDYAQLEANLKQIQRTAPSLRVNESSAFTVATSIWRIAEKAEKDGRFAAAAGWYLLGIEPMFASTGQEIQAKLARRGILALVQAGNTAAAQKVLRSSALQGDLAKNHFVKFYASVNDADQALGAIHDLVRAPDVKPSLLLWAHRVALERGEQKLAGRVLRAVATAFQETSQEQDGDIDINPLVLTRSIIRALLSDLKTAQDPKQRIALLQDITEQVTFAFTTIGARVKAGTASDDLGKELVWLYKTAFNLAADLQHEWDAAASKPMFRLIVDMMSYSRQLGVETDVETTSKLATCRLALIRSGLEEARLATATKDRIAVYRAVLSDAKDFLALPSRAGASAGDKAEEKKAAALAVLVEALYELEEWDELLKFAQSFETDFTQPLSALKLLVGFLVDADSKCPHEILSKILRKTLDVLYRRRDVDQPRMAVWLRAIVVSLLHRRELDEALKYIENAAHFIGQPRSTYPSEEADWMAATAWDEGIDFYAAASPRSGHAWCQAAVTIAKVTNGLLAQQWQAELDEMQKRYGGEERDHLVT